MATVSPDPSHIPVDGANNSPAAVSLSSASISLPILNQKFQFDLFSQYAVPDQETVAGLLQCFRNVYGSGYQFDELQAYDTYSRCHSSGDWISVIARDVTGIPVGHASVIKKEAGVVELGRLFIDPEVQGQGLGRLLSALQMDIVQELHASGKISVVIAEPVTTHQSSQRLYAEHNLETAGYFESRYTDFFSKGYRESVLRLTRVLDDSIKSNRTVYLPATLATIASELYASLGCERCIQVQPPTRRDRAQSQQLVIDMEELKAFGAVSLQPDSGRSPLTVVSDAGTAFAHGAHYVEVRINTMHPASLGQINALRLAGFYFAALEPYPAGDFVVLQRLKNGRDASVNAAGNSFYKPNAHSLVQRIESTRWPQSRYASHRGEDGL